MYLSSVSWLGLVDYGVAESHIGLSQFLFSFPYKGKTMTFPRFLLKLKQSVLKALRWGRFCADHASGYSLGKVPCKQHYARKFLTWYASFGKGGVVGITSCSHAQPKGWGQTTYENKESWVRYHHAQVGRKCASHYDWRPGALRAKYVYHTVWQLHKNIPSWIGLEIPIVTPTYFL